MIHQENLLSSDEDEDDDTEYDDGSSEGDEPEQDMDNDQEGGSKPKDPKTWSLAWPYGSPETNETWALNLKTKTWEQLASAPKPHIGWYLYRDRASQRQMPIDLKKCVVCSASSKKMPQCPCKTVSYCGPECQKQHWAVHKLTCPSRNADVNFVIRAVRRRSRIHSHLGNSF